MGQDGETVQGQQIDRRATVMTNAMSLIHKGPFLGKIGIRQMCSVLCYVCFLMASQSFSLQVLVILNTSCDVGARKSHRHVGHGVAPDPIWSISTDECSVVGACGHIGANNRGQGGRATGEPLDKVTHHPAGSWGTTSPRSIIQRRPGGNREIKAS